MNRWARVVGCTVVLAATGALAPEAARAEAGGVDRQPSGSQFEAAELAADLGVSPSEAQRRLQDQEALPELSGVAADTLGQDYGGVWVDPADGRVQLGVVGGGAQVSAEAQDVVQEAGVAASADVVTVDHSADELNAGVNWLSDRVAALSGPVATATNSGLRPDLNQVVLHRPADGTTDAALQALVAEAQSRFGDMLLVEDDGRPLRTLGCAYPYCDPPLRAGVGIVHSSNQFACTGAFLTRSRSDGKLYQLTAGHCAAGAPGGTWYTQFPDGSGHTIGPIQRTNFNIRADAAILRVSNPAGWRARAWVYVTPSATTTRNEAYPIRGAGRSVVGSRLCISGSYYGSSNCGQITELGITGPVCDSDGSCVTVSGLGRTNACAIPGDSGAPMYASNLALGILSGGYSDCDLVYSGISAVQNALNVDVAREG
jgi:streptogrisin C